MNPARRTTVTATTATAVALATAGALLATAAPVRAYLGLPKADSKIPPVPILPTAG